MVRMDVGIAFMPKRLFPQARAILLVQRAWSFFRERSANSEFNPFHAVVADHVDELKGRVRVSMRRRSLDIDTPTRARAMSKGTMFREDNEVRERSRSGYSDRRGSDYSDRSPSGNRPGYSGGLEKQVTKLDNRMEGMEGRMDNMERMLTKVVQMLQAQRTGPGEKPAAAASVVIASLPEVFPTTAEAALAKQEAAAAAAACGEAPTTAPAAAAPSGAAPSAAAAAEPPATATPVPSAKPPARGDGKGDGSLAQSIAQRRLAKNTKPVGGKP